MRRRLPPRTPWQRPKPQAAPWSSVPWRLFANRWGVLAVIVTIGLIVSGLEHAAQWLAHLRMNAPMVLTRMLWGIAAIAVCAVMITIASNYSHCRANGTGQLGCFVVSLIVSTFEILVFAIATVVKLLTFILT